MSNEEDTQAVPKTEPSRDGSFSSGSSSPEPELEENVAIAGTVQVQKRKGGRKPVFLSLMALCSGSLQCSSDLCNFGGEEAKESPSSGSLPRTADRVYQTTRDQHQASRRCIAEPTTEPSRSCR